MRIVLDLGGEQVYGPDKFILPVVYLPDTSPRPFGGVSRAPAVQAEVLSVCREATCGTR